MAYINKVYATNRNIVPGEGQENNIFIKAGDFNPLVDRVNSLATSDGVLSVTSTTVDYVTSTGTSVTNFLKFTGTVGTATDGTLFSTGSTWINHATAGQCAFKILASTSATSGDYATARFRGRADAVSSGGVEGINASASTTIANYGNLCAGYFAVQPNAITNNSASNIVTAIHAVIDRTGASSGRTWVAWIDSHQETKSSAGDYLMRFSHNGTIANDGCMTIYSGGRMPYLFNIEDAAGFLTDAPVSLTTTSGAMAVKTPAGVRYIALLTA